MSAPEAAGLSDEDFSALIGEIGAMAPLLKTVLGAGGDPAPDRKEGKGGDPREALLQALKPYLSPARRDAVDYLLRLARVSAAVRALRAP